MLSRFRFLTAPFGIIRGFITVPGIISLGGLLLGVVTLWLDRLIELADAGGNFSWLVLSNEAARQILSTVGASAMAALSLVYSRDLVGFRHEAGEIAPRL